MSDTETRDASLLKARITLRRMRDKGIKVEILSPLDRAAKNPSSFAHVIAAVCWDCVGHGDDPGAKDTITHCQVFSCPLWHLRPWRTKAEQGWGDSERKKAIAMLPESSPTHKALLDPTSKAKALYAKCYECMGGEDISIVELRSLIAGCKAEFPVGENGGYRGCPIWPKRRWKVPGKKGD